MEKEVSFIPLIIYLVNIVMAPGAWQKTNTRKQELSALGSCLSHEGLWAVSKHWIINSQPPGRTPQIAARRLLWTPYATAGDCSTGSLRCLKTRRRADGMGCEFGRKKQEKIGTKRIRVAAAGPVGPWLTTGLSESSTYLTADRGNVLLTAIWFLSSSNTFLTSAVSFYFFPPQQRRNFF